VRHSDPRPSARCWTPCQRPTRHRPHDTPTVLTRLPTGTVRGSTVSRGIKRCPSRDHLVSQTRQHTIMLVSPSERTPMRAALSS
jgi:hypothetical protein